MPLRCAALVSAVLAATLVLAPTASGAELPRPFWGALAFDRPTIDEARSMQETAGIETVRVQFHWRAIEPNRPPPEPIAGMPGRSYEWTATDRWVGNLARAGIRPHATLIGSPYWLTQGDQDHTPARTAEGQREWRLFVRAVARRYGRGGSFWRANPAIPAQPIDTFMVWNEQNSVARYKPRPNPREYATLVRIAASEIRAASPHARVLLGGMFGTPQGAGAIDAWDFLRQLYAVPGARASFDAVGVHPYAPNLRGIRWQINNIRRAMRENQDGQKPIEITEIGWSSQVGCRHFFCQGPREQARKLRLSFAMLVRNRERWRIERIIWTGWRNTEQRPGCFLCTHFGLVRDDLSPKPALRPYTRFVAGELPRPARGRR